MSCYCRESDCPDCSGAKYDAKFWGGIKAENYTQHVKNVEESLKTSFKNNQEKKRADAIKELIDDIDADISNLIKTKTMLEKILKESE